MKEDDKPQVLRTVSELKLWRSKRNPGSLALVPTMGNLHAGHAALVEAARGRADRVLVSIFVNPTQFSPDEDYANYPRSLEEDLELLRECDANAVFAPAPEEIYPLGVKRATAIEVPAFSDLLEGASRPGHFRGVASVVVRLFNLAAPDIAVFGEKDYQQLLVIRRMVTELFLPVEILGVPTVRASDGLALSSRNRYLTPGERRGAPGLHRALTAGAEALGRGAQTAEIELAGAAELTAAGFKVEYFAVRDAATLGAPTAGCERIILAAARLGKARLIDSLHLPG
ncbi:MAG: pantoate--beta-alanine ligase [Gammaproteobacteria bacterium]